MERLFPDSPVRALPGIGDSRAAAFARMGVNTLYDLVMHFPRAYENRGAVHRAAYRAHSPRYEHHALPRV